MNMFFQATKGAELTEELVKMKKAEEESKVETSFNFDQFKVDL